MSPAAPTFQADPGSPLARWRFWVASLLILLFGLLGMVRALQEPSLGWRFVAGAQGIEALPLSRGQPVLHGVWALSARGQRVELTPELLIESAGILNRYDQQARFFTQHAGLWQLLAGPEVAIEHAGGRALARPEPRELAELGPRFWFPWVVALLSMSVGLAVWVFRSGDTSARWYMLASLGYGFGMLCTAGWGSRLLTQAPQLWRELHVASHAASFLLIGGLCMLLWQHPNRLGLRAFPWLLGGLCTASLVADALQGLPTISIAFRLPAVLVCLALAVLYALQWRASRGDPVKRAQLKWLGLLLFAALSAVFVAYSFGAMGYVVSLPQNFGLGLVGLVFVGLVPLVTRIGLFRLDRWWTAAWLWFLGGLLVVGLDMALLALLPLSNEMALALALAAGGWAYFPLRQALWRRLSRGALPETRDVLPDVVALVTQGGADAAYLNARWAALWDRLFEPQHVRPGELQAQAVQITGHGQALQIPGGSGLHALELRLAARGARLFNTGDLRRAEEIVQLVRHGLAAQESYQRGVREERQRIASDLHDDLGAKLLTIAQAGAQAASPGGERMASLARQALDEMRLSVRGLAGEAALAADVLADWRAETVTRLAGAGFTADWQADEPPPALVLPARTHVQLTRILREAVSNAIRHSGGTVCRVRITLDGQSLGLVVQDNGAGMAAAGGGAGSSAGGDGGGHGLPGIERRVRKLGGSHTLQAAPGGGTQLQVTVPLAGQSATIDPP